MSHQATHSGEPDRHDEVLRLLPWYVNRSLDAAEREGVRAHLERCPWCREELAVLTTLSDLAAASPVPELSPQAGFTRLRGDLVKRRPSLAKRVREGFQRPPVIRFAIALALLVLVLPLGWRLWQIWTEPRFYTLGNPTTAARAGDLRIVFDAEAGPERIGELLRSVGGTLVQGPDAAGVSTIRLAGSEPARVESAIARLRGQEGVLLVEPANHP